MYSIGLIVLSAFTVVVMLQSGLSTVSKQLDAITHIKSIMEERCLDEYTFGGYYPQKIEGGGGSITLVNKEYLIDQLIESDTYTKS